MVGYSNGFANLLGHDDNHGEGGVELVNRKFDRGSNCRGVVQTLACEAQGEPEGGVELVNRGSNCWGVVQTLVREVQGEPQAEGGVELVNRGSSCRGVVQTWVCEAHGEPEGGVELVNRGSDCRGVVQTLSAHGEGAILLWMTLLGSRDSGVLHTLDQP